MLCSFNKTGGDTVTKTKEELAELVLKYLRSSGGMDINPELNFQELLPKYQTEIKEILVATIRNESNDWIAHQAMWCLVEYFADASSTKLALCNVLSLIMAPNPTMASVQKNTREWLIRSILQQSS